MAGWGLKYKVQSPKSKVPERETTAQQRVELTQEPFWSEGQSGLNQPPAFFDAKSESKAAVTLATLPASVNYSLVAGEERWVWAGEMRGAES